MSLPQRCAVVGAGTMGPGMALMLARTGSQVKVMDLTEELLERARRAVRAAGEALVGVAEMTQEGLEEALGRISYTTAVEEAVRDAEFVIEAVPERLEIKNNVYAQLETYAPDSAILASNTSGIPITKLQEGSRLPGRIVGMHWSNPPHIIPVIEVIKGAQTDDHAVAVTRALTEAMGHIPVTVKRDVPGFVENRVLYAIMREALHLLEEDVASAEDIDRTVQWGIGFKLAVIPPLALLDVAGLDIYNSVASYLNADLSASAEVSPVVKERVQAGHLGVKTGRGLFEYGEGELPKLMQRRMALLLKLKQAIYNTATE